MAAVARVLSRSFPLKQIDIEVLQTIGTFCGLGLLASLFLLAVGWQLSVDLF
jgi:hypothetical protein